MCLGYLKHLNVSRAFKCIALLSGRKPNVSVRRKNYFNDYFVNAILSLRNAVGKQMVAEGFRNVERERETTEPENRRLCGRAHVLALYEETRGLSADWTSANFW